MTWLQKIGISALSIIVITFFWYSVNWGSQPTPPIQTKKVKSPSRLPVRSVVPKPRKKRKKPPKPKIKTFTLAAVGDVMMASATRRPYRRGRDLFKECTPYLKDFDVVFFNHESAMTDKGKPIKRYIPGKSYFFGTPPSYAKYLKRAGFNMASMGNNHASDFGWIGLRETRKHMKRIGVVTSSHYGDIAKMTVRGIKIVMVAFYISRRGKFNLNDIEGAKKTVKKLAAKHDIVIVSFHGGAEGKSKTRVPRKLERYLGERRGDVFHFSRGVIDAGADVVLGHGPHVPRAMELYKGRLIAYSLGNFVTTGFAMSSYYGYAPLLQAELTVDGRLIGGRVVSFLQSWRKNAYLDKSNKVAKFIHELGKKDFPKTNLVGPEGKFIIPNKAQVEDVQTFKALWNSVLPKEDATEPPKNRKMPRKTRNGKKRKKR